MVRAPHHRTQGNREFTDRVAPLGLFESALAEPQTAELGPLEAYRVIVWHGVGGQGKTELRKACHRKIEEHRAAGSRISASVLDFGHARHRCPVEAMLKVRLDLGESRLIAFPTFDVAFTQLFSLEHPGDDIRAIHPGLFRDGESEIAQQLLQWAADAANVTGGVMSVLVPGTGLLYRYGHLLVDRLWEWWDSREAKRHIGEIDALSASELRENLPVYLGYDLWRALQADESLRVVLLIDTYEALWRDASGQGAMQTPLADGWVRSLVEASPGALIAIFGRDRLRWAEFDEDWDVILDHQPLDGLSDGDAGRFLEKAGVASQPVRARIVKSAQGLPYCLDLALDLFDELNGNDDEPSAEEFGDTPNMVLHRFLDHLSEDELLQLRLASYPEDIDRALLVDLAREFLGGAANADWRRLVQRSFMTEFESGSASMHAKMREGLQARERDEREELFRDVHLWLFDRFDARANSAVSISEIGEEHDRALLAAAAHLNAAEASRLQPWLLEERWQKYYDAGRWQALSGAFELAGSRADSNPELCWFDHHHAHVCQSMGRYDEAQELYERAQKNYKVMFGDEHADYATMLHALGDVQRILGRAAEAESKYAHALRIYEATPGAYDQRFAEVLFSLALMNDANGRVVEARRQYKRALETFGTADNVGGRDYADFVLKVGRAQQAHGRNDEAEALYLSAQRIYQSSGSNMHEGYAATLVDLSVCLATRGERDEAEASFARATSIYAEVLGEAHPNLGQALHLQAAFWSQDDNRRGAAKAQLERAVAILNASLGDEHEWTKNADANLRRLQMDGLRT